MALWQWDVYILPKSEVVARFSPIPLTVGLDQVEAIRWDFGLDIERLAAFFDSQLPRYSTPWMENTRSWGSDAGNRIELYFEKLNITDIAIRVDLRQLDQQFLKSLSEFCYANNYVFYPIETGEFIEPDCDLLLGAISRSRKMKFVSDPRSFFEDKERLDAVNRDAREKMRKMDKLTGPKRKPATISAATGYLNTLLRKLMRR
jgi:hypothetical protein